MAHCVTARWRNFSHYCRPLRHYDVWFTWSDNREALQPRRRHTVYTNKRLEFATEHVGKLRYVTAVEGELKRFPWVAWFAHPCSKRLFVYTVWCRCGGQCFSVLRTHKSDVILSGRSYDTEQWHNVTLLRTRAVGPMFLYSYLVHCKFLLLGSDL